MVLPRNIFTFICMLMLSFPGIAQEVVEPGQDVLYRKEKHGGILIHSNGFGAFYRDGKHLTGKTKRMFEFELVNMKHPKEIKISPTGESSQSFVLSCCRKPALFFSTPMNSITHRGHKPA